MNHMNPDFFNRAQTAVSTRICDTWWKIYSKFRIAGLRLVGIGVGPDTSFRGKCECWRFSGSTISIGDGCIFNSSSRYNHIGLNHRCILTTMNPGAELTVGDKVGMSSSSITAFKSVRIGNNVRIGANCVIMDGDFHLEDPRAGEPDPVSIGDNVWL